ncbi:MAG: PAC2 family protein [Candidatus Hodarchaeales archaeon]
MENLTSEIEDWLEKADDVENLKFIKLSDPQSHNGLIALELLGYYGSVGQLITQEINKVTFQQKKLGGFFSSYFNEMIQLVSGEIRLPITLIQSQLGDSHLDFILTTSNFAIPDIICYRLAEELYEFYKENKVSKIILIDGAYNYKRKIDKKPRVHRISSLKSQIEVKNSKNSDFTLMGQIASSFLTYWGNNRDIPVEIFAVDAFSKYDPSSSLELLKVIFQEWGIKGDLSELERKSEEFNQSFLHSSVESRTKTQENSLDPRFFI